MGSTKGSLDKQLVLDYDLKDTEALEREEFYPALKLDAGNSWRGSFLTDAPRVVEWVDKKDGSPKSARIIDGENSIGERVSIWLSAVSMKTAIARIAKKHGCKLKGVEVIISAHTEDLPKYGKTKQYTAHEPSEFATGPETSTNM